MVAKAVLAGSVMLATQLEASEIEEKNIPSTDDIHTGSLGLSNSNSRTEVENTPTLNTPEVARATTDVASISNNTTGSIGSTSSASNVISETGLPRDFVSQSPGVSDPAQQTREVPQNIASFERGQTNTNVNAGSSNQSPLVNEGIDGEDGANGRDGVDGLNGTNGQDGENGIQGADGRDGTDGSDGINGLSTVYLDANLFEGTDYLDILSDSGFDVTAGPLGSVIVIFDPARTQDLINVLDDLTQTNNSFADNPILDPFVDDTPSNEPEHGATSNTGTESDDFLSGDENNNVISGFGGNDHLSGGTGADTLLGGDGLDTADYRNSEDAVHVDLSTSEALFGDAEGDILVSIEHLAGSAGDDILTGDGDDNRLTGRDGNDILSGGAGNDRLIGGEGADRFNGGEGNRDAADFNLAEEAVGVDLLNGGFMGEALGDSYSGIEFIVGSAYHDILLANDDANRINGGDGCDVLNGRGGNDTLIGDAGDDVLNGGEGADVFIFGEDSGYDIIEDFEAGAGRTDRVWLQDHEFDSFADIQNAMAQTENGVTLALDSGTILFQDISLAEFHADDFILA